MTAREAANIDALPPCPALFPWAALMRSIPWPDAYANAPLNPSAEALRTGAGSLPCVRFAYAFFYLSAAQAEALLGLALTVADRVLAIDFKLAERNLELPATLAARGLMALTGWGLFSRRPNIRAEYGFMRMGGIEGLARQSNATVLERHPLLGGAAALLHLQRA